ICFFSSRRRHTRSLRDWSSDVCSSDLKTFHKDRFKRLYNARRIVDGSGVDHPIKFRNGDLILTNDPIEWARQRFPGMRLVSIGRSEERRVGKEWRTRSADATGTT